MKEDKTFDSKFWKSIIPFIIIIVFIFFLPFIIIKYSWFGIDFSKSIPVASGINGFIGPFVAIVAAFLTYIAFWVQYKANKQQLTIFSEQRKDIQVERFQNKFYELLNLHNANVQMIISSSSNKYSYFMNMINDLRKHYKIVEMFFIEYKDSNKTFTDDSIN